MKFKIVIAERWYSDILVEADTLEEALDKVRLDDYIYTGTAEYDELIMPDVLNPWYRETVEDGRAQHEAIYTIKGD